MKRGQLKKLVWIGVVSAVIVSTLAFGCTQPATPTTTTKTTTTTTTSVTTTTTKTTTPSGPQYGGTLRLVTGLDANVLGYPPLMTMTQESLLSTPVLETLVRVDDATGVPSPWLATGWTIATDLKSITMTLRKDVKFHDGTDFNATICKWNLDAYKATGRISLAAVSSVDIIDDYTIRFNLSKWDNSQIINLTGGAGMMISKAAYDQNGQDWCANHPIGTGPFKFVSWTRDSKQVYTRFDGYWQPGKPYLDRIELLLVKDPMTMTAVFLAGDADVINGPSYTDLINMQKNTDITIVSCKSNIQGFAGYSKNSASPFADIRVRQAMQYAVDSATIVKALGFGFDQTTNQYATPGSWGYNPNVVGYPYNPTKATALLTAAGYSASNPLKANLYYLNNQYPADQFTAVQAQLKAVNILVTLKPCATALWNQMAVGVNGTWSDGIMHITTGQSVDDLASFAGNFSARGNWVGIGYPQEYEDLIDQAKMQTDFAKEKEMVWQMQSMFVDKYCLAVFISARPGFGAQYPQVMDLAFKSQSNTQWNPANVWIKK